MAARKVKLSAPAEFISKPRKPLLKDTEAKGKSDNNLLFPPSRYTAPSGISQKANQESDQEDDKRKNLHVQGLNEEITKIKETSTDLLNEIKKCKNQNALLEENLTRQLKDNLRKNHEDSKADLSKVSNAYTEIQKCQEQSGMFHASLQRQIEKQAETIQKLTGNYFEHQNDLLSENEKLRTKLSRLTEEYKEMKSYLEKEIEAKEAASFNLLSDIRKSNKVLENLKENKELEKKEFLSAIETQNIILEDLKKELNILREKNKNLVTSKTEEIERITDQYNEERMRLKKELELKSSDLKLYKKKYKESVNKGNERFYSVENEVKTIKIESQKIKQELSEKEKLFEKLKEKSDLEKATDLAMIYDLKKQCDDLEASHLSELDNIHQQYHKRIQKEEITSKELKETLEKQSRQLRNAQEEMEKLHAYISELTNDKNVKKYEKEIEHLREEKHQLKETCKSLESANELLNVRLMSLSNVIKIQETEISKDGIPFAGEKTASLLNKWRDKVYCLLVQLKSQQIMENEDIRNLQIKLKLYQEEAKDSKSKVALLNNQLRDKVAEMEMVVNKEEQIKKERDSIMKRENELKGLLTNYERCFITLYQQLKLASTTADLNIGRFNKAMTSLKALESRLNFAKERLKTMEELLIRKDVLLHSKLDEAKEKSKKDSKQTEIGEIDQDVLLKEVQSLTKERQLLLNQLKENTEELSRIKKELAAEYKGKLETRDEHIEELEKEAEVRNLQISEMEKELCDLRESKKNFEEELETLKFDVQRNQTGFEKALESKRDEDRRTYEDELAKKDMIINEVQRENTKTILSLRQMERQLAWQKQNTFDILKENNEIHKLELEKINKNAVDLEKERNLLLTTIKQENIKVPRMKPVAIDNSIACEDQHQEKRQHHSKVSQKAISSEQKSKKRKSKPKDSDSSSKISGMLKELESISNALLQEDTKFGLETNLDNIKEPENSASSEF